MARIRSIHPNACTSEKLARANGDEERCYWRLQTHCDDEGRAEDHPRLIWAALFPLNEDVGPEDVDKWLQCLNDIGLIQRYEVDGKRYLCVIGWSEKQSPRHPTPSKFPPPPEAYGDPPQHDREAPEDDRQTCRGEGVEVGEGGGGVPQAEPAPDGAAKPRASRIPDEFNVTPEMETWALSKCPDIDWRNQTERFVNHWKAKSGKDATKLDWERTWKNWLLQAQDWTAKKSPVRTHL